MIRTIRVESFKSLARLDLELGQVNVLIGANGSGKSNILEAIGILGAAGAGRVDDEALLRRGVRPGVPALYKSAFFEEDFNESEFSDEIPHITFGASTRSGAAYEVTLGNPLEDPSPAWRFETEKLLGPRKKYVNRSAGSRENQEQGLAALKTVDLKVGDPALALLNLLRNFSIYSPNTPTLRGLMPDLQSREPVGLAGGRLPDALQELLETAQKQHFVAAQPTLWNALGEVTDLIDWARSFSAGPARGLPLSPSAARSQLVIQFQDRYMDPRSSELTGYDASEGALYILYYAVLALHPKAPAFLAVDNIDQALNPRLASRLMSFLSRCIIDRKETQWIATTHNPATLDGLPLDREEVRLFVVDRNSKGHTVAQRIDLKAALAARPDESWTLSRMWTAGLIGGLPNV